MTIAKGAAYLKTVLSMTFTIGSGSFFGVGGLMQLGSVNIDRHPPQTFKAPFFPHHVGVGSIQLAGTVQPSH